MEKFGFTSIYDFPRKEKSNHENVLDIYDKITYRHGADYTIFINSSINFATENIYTFRNGQCHKIQPLEKMEANQRVMLEIINNDVKEEEGIIFLVSDNSWQGITDDILPYFHPSKIVIQLKPLRYQVSLSLEKINHLNGVENFSDCIKSLVQFSDCIEQCVPFYLYVP